MAWRAATPATRGRRVTDGCSPTLDYERPDVVGTRTPAQVRWAIASHVVGYGVPPLAVVYSYLGLCWASWRHYRRWGISIVFAPATGTDLYDRLFIDPPLFAITLAPLFGTVVAFVATAVGRMRLSDAFRVSLSLPVGWLFWLFVFVGFASEASP